MHIKIDTEKCISAGQCAMVAEGIFDNREEDGVVVLLCEEPPGDREAAVRQAIRLCPSGAIGFEEPLDRTEFDVVGKVD